MPVKVFTGRLQDAKGENVNPGEGRKKKKAVKTKRGEIPFYPP